jgi:hypothetical protein
MAVNEESQSKEREKKRNQPRSHRPAATNLMAAPILPVEPWSCSSVTQERLEDLVEEGLLRPITDVAMPEWITPEEGLDVPNPPASYVLSFVAFHERGL